MKLFPVAFALIGLIISAPVVQAAPQTRPQTSPTPIPIAPNSLVFELRLPKGKTQFQQGETIPIHLLFSNRGTQTLCLNTYHESPPSLVTFASFTAQPQEDTSNPLGDLPKQTGWFYEGPPPPSPRILTSEQEKVTLILNEYIRFDRPGTYQLRATTNHVFAVPPGQSAPRQGSFFERGPVVTSSPLTIEIAPAQPQWQQEQVTAWRTYWSKQKPDAFGFGWEAPSGLARPTSDLRFLNTRASAQAMIDRLGQDIAPRSSGSEAYFWRTGFIGFPERLWLINAMKEAIARPDYTVTQGFLNTLSTLQALYHTPHSGQFLSPDLMTLNQDTQSLADWQLTLKALPSKRGRTRALTIHSLLESAWYSNLGKAPSVQRQLPRLAAMVPTTFNDLPILPQQYLLDDSEGISDEWNKVKSPRFVQPLLTAWKTVPHAQGWARERGDLILKHLYELNPTIGRSLMLQEMASPQPRVSFATLSRLPDKYLPQLQNIWWTHLTSNGPDQETAALLIGRYATPALKSRARQEYNARLHGHLLSSDVDAGLKRYLARVGG